MERVNLHRQSGVSEIISPFDQLLMAIGAFLLVAGLILIFTGIRQFRTKKGTAFTALIGGFLLIVPLVAYAIDYFFFTNQ